ncbi:MAG: PIN domain-containing protein [Saprospiraceae bacterium]|nr:PIN domain-containing protein [Saprospiraceae bacterium]
MEKRKMPQQIKGIFQATMAGSNEIWIPAMVLAEVGYLAERKRISATVADVSKLVSTNQNFHFQELSADIVSLAFQIPDIPELHDRLIAATAHWLKIPLLTNDPAIQNSAAVQTIWA